jgi:hypothetical protein
MKEKGADGISPGEEVDVEKGDAETWSMERFMVEVDIINNERVTLCISPLLCSSFLWLKICFKYVAGENLAHCAATSSIATSSIATSSIEAILLHAHHRRFEL